MSQKSEKTYNGRFGDRPGSEHARPTGSFRTRPTGTYQTRSGYADVRGRDESKYVPRREYTLPKRENVSEDAEEPVRGGGKARGVAMIIGIVAAAIVIALLFIILLGDKGKIHQMPTVTTPEDQAAAAADTTQVSVTENVADISSEISAEELMEALAD